MRYSYYPGCSLDATGRQYGESIHAVGYYLGYRKNMPTFAKFNYAEKMEYWALVWGTIVMAGTGRAPLISRQR